MAETIQSADGERAFSAIGLVLAYYVSRRRDGAPSIVVFERAPDCESGRWVAWGKGRRDDPAETFELRLSTAAAIKRGAVDPHDVADELVRAGIA